MGCRHTKSVELKQSIDSEWKTGKEKEKWTEENLSAIPPALKTCEKLGVSSKHIYSLRQSWKGIKRNMEETGVEMFVR